MHKEGVCKKAMHFLAALSDVYRHEDSRDLPAFSALEFGDDVTDDFTAMLVAMATIFDNVVGYDGDLIDFTHVLNKMAVQYVMDGGADNGL